ncbi:arylsulfatase [Purpureocillium lavendulum]|uniref:Arylsulfatase n=1 Tax=Purpureocillium lavendulum TaxID=1247861 RepID=A0AB34FR62_9HYPO|nr:arylsulfatase [Purpureocillium lavendulum]
MAPKKKNILLLVADDLGREQLGCYGCSAIQTPHLDALAASGTRFDMAFASTASCSGSRTTLYTGLHTHENGSYGLVLERNGFQTWANVETAPRVFNDLGYRTGILGKVHVAPDAVYPWQVRHESETRDVAVIADQAERFFEESAAAAAAAAAGDDDDDDEKNDEASSNNKGFFLTIGYVDPHRVLASRGGFGNAEADAGTYDARIRDRVYTPDEVAVPSFLQDLPAVRQELAEYYRAINRLDQGVGLVLAALERAGLADDTLVLFLSDNGPPFVNSKTTLYDAGVRLPFLMRAPGMTANVVSPNLVSWIDVLPTMLAWAGHEGRQPPEGSVGPRKGRSLLPIAHKAEVVPGWDRVFGSHTFHEITNYWPTRYMRTRRWKYHRNVCWRLDFPFAMDLYASLSFDAMRNSGAAAAAPTTTNGCNGTTTSITTTNGDHSNGKATGGKAIGGSSSGAPSPAMIGKRTLKSYIRRPAEELYDLDADPDEVRNLAGEAGAAHAETLAEMRRAVEAWQYETRDLWLWKDGVSVQRFREFDYEREGLRIPDRLDFDVDRPGTEGVPTIKLH